MMTTGMFMLIAVVSLAAEGAVSKNGAFRPKLREHGSCRIDQAPSIDGSLSDSAWQAIQPTDSMIQSFPDPGQPATFATRIWVAHDDQALYIGARCQDPRPEKVVARVTRRDRWIESDWFQVDIDSRRDRRTGFFFAVNAAGVRLDGTLFNENQESTDWDGVWQAGTRVTEEGWNVEMRIPFRLLRFSASEDVQFGINFSRRISRLNESDQWQYIPPESGLRVSRFGVLKRLDLPSHPVSLEVSPYLAARQDYQADGAASSDVRPFDVGVDGKLSLGSNFMLTMTANPDFGQVEVDQMVFNLSTIETYFPEKRTFFLEDRSLFMTPKFGDGDSRAELFYTRRIGRAPRTPDLEDDEELIGDPLLPRIYGAAKLAGRTDGRLSVGVLQAVTSRESALVRGPGGSEYRKLAEPLSSYSILRLKQEFWENSSVGVMGTALAAGQEGTAVTGGSDLQLELFDGGYNLTLLTQFSHLTEDRFRWHDDFTSTALEREGATGFGGELTLWKKSGDHLVGAVGTSYRSPSLALNDVGYLDRPDVFSTFLWMQFRHLKPVGPIARIYLNANAWLYRNTDFLNLSDGGNLNGQLVFKNNWMTGFWAGYNTPNCDDRETRTGGEVVFCNANHRGGLGAWLSTDQKSMVSASLDSFAFKVEHGWAWQLSVPVTFNFTSRLQLDLIPTYQRKTGSLRWIDTQETGAGDRHLFSDQHAEFWDITVRGTFTFTTDLTLQAFGQVLLAAVDNTTKYAPPALDAERIHSADLVEVTDVEDDYDYTFANLNLSVVLRWEYLPGSVGYLVYTGCLGHDLENPDFRFGRVFGDLFARDANHTLMLKLSYLFG